MGDDAVISEGIDSSEAKASLYSTVHGAGRLFGRKEAMHRFSAPRWIPGCKRAA
jgi:tRNA-splicing ligase RtcB